MNSMHTHPNKQFGVSVRRKTKLQREKKWQGDFSPHTPLNFLILSQVNIWSIEKIKLKKFSNKLVYFKGPLILYLKTLLLSKGILVLNVDINFLETIWSTWENICIIFELKS